MRDVYSGGTWGHALTAPCALTNWYTTPNGRYLLFGDSLQVGANNVAADGCAEAALPSTQGEVDGRCTELYRYDAQAAERGETPSLCVSCGSQEANSAGNAEFARSADYGPAAGPVRAMSDDGEYVFFDTQASLVSGASNGTLDTYEWHDGQVSLSARAPVPRRRSSSATAPNTRARTANG